MRRLGLIAAIPAAVLGAVLLAAPAHAAVSSGTVREGKAITHVTTSQPAPVAHMGTHCQMVG
jgi:hypothetical protein